MKTVNVKDAVGMILGHDMTEIIPGKSKGAAFKKGHVIKIDDIPRLLNMGKEHIYVMEFMEDDVHEDEAAIRIAEAATGQGIRIEGPKEGKSTLTAAYRGLLKINLDALTEMNSMDEIMFASLHQNIIVEKDEAVAGTRVIPLMVKEWKVKKVEEICNKYIPVIQIKPFKKLRAGIVTTGSEVYHGRIKDQFGPVVKNKFEELDCTVLKHIFSDDDPNMIADSIKELIDLGADVIAVTGGMSVDPDDVTPLGIRMAGADVLSYGAPTLPGAMFLLSYIGDIPVLGLPGCVMYSKRTIFDLILPRIVTGEKVTKSDVVKLGHGGLCRNCEDCRYPNCGFGRG
ncbi:MAG: molybdopterin-binding protein [Solirubrobacterales bacterium]